MNLHIPTVCLVCSGLIIGICFVAQESAAQSRQPICCEVAAAALNMSRV